MKPAKRPPGLLCTTCARRVLGASITSPPSGPAEPQLNLNAESVWLRELRTFQLKLRDWLGVERVELRPCLSVCPEAGMTFERRGKTMVLDAAAIALVQKQFDPTRQLSFLEPDS